MGFRNDFSQARDNELKPEGDYEVIIARAEEKTAQSGKIYLNISMVIRNDVEQAYKNGWIFHSLWKRKEPTAADMQVNGYGFGQIMSLGKAAKLPDGKDYADLGEFLADLINKPVRVHLIHDEYNGTKRESVQYLNPTDFPQVNHTFKKKAPDAFAAPQASYAAAASRPAAPDLTDEDLPF